MNFIEKKIDIFDEINSYDKNSIPLLCFCCSGDFNLQAGISQKIDEKYGVESFYKENFLNSPSGSACPYILYNLVIIALVNRDKKWQGTTYDEMLDCIIHLKEYCLEHYIQQIFMPRIACGLDMMNWDIIRPIIKEQFENLDINITVCYI